MFETLLTTLHSRVSAECRGSLKDTTLDLPEHLHAFSKVLVATAPNDPSIVYVYDPTTQKWIFTSSEKKPPMRKHPVFERKRDKEYGKMHIVEAASKCPLVRKMLSKYGFEGVSSTPICLLAKWLGSKGVRLSVHKAILRSKLIFRVDDANLFLDSTLKRIVATNPTLYKKFVREAVDADDLLFNGNDPFKVLSYIITVQQMKDGGIAIEHEALLVDRPVKRSCKKLQQQIVMLVGAERKEKRARDQPKTHPVFNPLSLVSPQPVLPRQETVHPVVFSSKDDSSSSSSSRTERSSPVPPPQTAETKVSVLPSPEKRVLPEVGPSRQKKTETAHPVVFSPKDGPSSRTERSSPVPPPQTAETKVSVLPSPEKRVLPEVGPSRQKKTRSSVVDSSAYFYQALDSMAAVFTLYNDPSVNAEARNAFDNMREKMFLVDEFVLSTRVDYSLLQLRNLDVFGYASLDTRLERKNTFHNRIGIRLLICASEDDLAVVNMMVDAMRVDALSVFGSVEGLSSSAIQRFEAYQSKWRKGMVRDLVDFNSETIALRFEQLREAANNYFDLDSILAVTRSLTADTKQLDEVVEIRDALRGPRREYSTAYHRTVDPFKNGLIGNYGNFADLARNIRIDDSIPESPSSPTSSSS